MNSSDLEKKIGIAFKNKNLLNEALTHRSYLNENPSWGRHNERMEFLGDSVLELITSEFLYKKYFSLCRDNYSLSFFKVIFI